LAPTGDDVGRARVRVRPRRDSNEARGPSALEGSSGAVLVSREFALTAIASTPARCQTLRRSPGITVTRGSEANRSDQRTGLVP